MKLSIVISVFFALQVSQAGEDTAPADSKDKSGYSKVPNNSRIARDDTAKTGSRFYLNLYGKCVAGRHKSKVSKFLAAPSNSKEQYDMLDRMSGLHGRSSCAKTDITFPVTALRGVVSENWYLSQGKALRQTVVGAKPYLPDLGASVNRIFAASENMRAQMVVDEFAACVAATQPVGVDALVRTTAGSRKEKSAISDLSNGFGQCAIDGQKLKFNYESLRAALAYALAKKSVGFGPEPEKLEAAE